MSRLKELSREEILKIAFIAITFLFLLSCTNREKGDTAEKNTPSLERFQEIKGELFDKGFQEILRGKGIGTDRWFDNEYETLQKKNLYVNHFYNLSIDLPDNLQLERGRHEFSLIKAADPDYGISLTLGVIPVTVNMGNDQRQNLSIEEWRNNLKSMSGIEPENLKLESLPTGSYLFKGVSYRILQHFPSGNPYYMRIITINLSMFNNTYTVSYSAPDSLFDMQLLIQVLNTFHIANPQWSTKR